MDEAGLMSGRVAGSIDDQDRVVAEDVQIFLHEIHWMLLLKRRPAVRGRFGNPCFSRSKVIIILSFLDEERHGGKQFGIADVVGMRMGNSHEFYFRWLDADRGKLRLERLCARPMDVR